MGYFVEVYEPGQPGRRQEVSAGRGTVGTGAGDSVRLPGSPIFGPGALRIFVSEVGVEVVARDSGAPLIWQGSKVASAQVSWGEEVYLGQMRLGFVCIAGAKRRTSPLVPVAVVVAFVLAISLIVRLGRSELAAAPSPEPPALDAQGARCQTTVGPAALRLAEQAVLLARAKEQRFPFAREEGMEALDLYAKASVCFGAGGAQEQARSVGEEQRRWKQKLERDFRDLRLRLELALRAREDGAALRAAQALEALLRDRFGAPAGEYFRWLTDVRTQLDERVRENQR